MEIKQKSQVFSSWDTALFCIVLVIQGKSGGTVKNNIIQGSTSSQTSSSETIDLSPHNLEGLGT